MTLAALTEPTTDPQDQPCAGPGEHMTPLQLARALKTLGWSQKELGGRVGATRMTTWRWLRGEYPIPDELADWLNDRVRAERSLPPAPQNWRK